MNQRKERDKNQKDMQSMPDDFTIISAGESLESSDCGSIHVFNPNFPNNATSFKVCNEGKNLSGINATGVTEIFLMGNFTTITNPEGSGMLIIAYQR